jgi:hypothetical protein
VFAPSAARTSSFFRQSFDDSSVQGLGSPAAGNYSASPAASVSRPAGQVHPALLVYRTYCNCTPEITHVLHDNARRFGKLFHLFSRLSTAYKSALMEIPEPMMTRSIPRGRGRQPRTVSVCRSAGPCPLWDAVWMRGLGEHTSPDRGAAC